MASLYRTSTIHDLQEFERAVYGLNNDRLYSTFDMLTQVQRFITRALKGIRKEEKKKATLNLLITMLWFMSLMNQLHINVQEVTQNRFPNRCSYCGNRPCSCRKEKRTTRKKFDAAPIGKVLTIAELQGMFAAIYPARTRTLEHAGIHLAEELGELAEAIMAFRGNLKDREFEKISQEAADFVSCLFGVCNSWDIDVAQELARMFSRNCHVCRQAPCACTPTFIANFAS